LLELARELHLARLEEYPRNLSDALQRRDAHEAARRAWLEDQAKFEDVEEPSAR
jgi:predicted transcriptional regulator